MNLLALVIGDFRGELAGFINRTNNRKVLIISAAGIKVILTESWGNVDDTGTVFS